MTETEARGCETCAHARDHLCHRGRKPHRQTYERYYTDDDFCGPEARFYQPRPFLRRVLARIRTLGGIHD